MTKVVTQPSKETPKQRGAFLIYFNLGEKRSLVNVQQELSEKGTKISETSLAKWSKKYQWVERVQKMDQEVMDRSEEIAIKNATVKKSDILKTVKNTMIRYNKALLDGTTIPSAGDFKTMWEIGRKELGKDLDKSPAIKIEINQRILSIVQKAEEDARKIIVEEINNE